MATNTKKRASSAKISRSTTVHKSKAKSRKTKVQKKGLLSRIHNMNGFGYAAILVVIALVGVSVMAINSNASASTVASLCHIAIQPHEILANQSASFNVTITNNSTAAFDSNTPISMYETFSGSTTQVIPEGNNFFGTTPLEPGVTTTYPMQAINLPAQYRSVKIIIKSSAPVFSCNKVIVRQVTSLTKLGAVVGGYTQNGVNTFTVEKVYACINKTDRANYVVNSFEVSTPGVPATGVTASEGGTLYNLSSAPTNPPTIDPSTVLSHSTSYNWDSSQSSGSPSVSEIINSVTIPIPANSSSYIGYQTQPSGGTSNTYLSPTNSLLAISKTIITC